MTIPYDSIMRISFILAFVAPFTSTVFGEEHPWQIMFCSDEYMQGECTWIWIDALDTCYYVPDPSKQGDKHSSFNVSVPSFGIRILQQKITDLVDTGHHCQC